VHRALTVLQLLPALHSGGVERSTLEIGAALVAAGHRSLVASAGGRLVAELERDGSRHVTLDLGRKSLRTLRHVHSLRRLIERERPDIVHARSRLPAWIAHFALRGLGAARPAFVTTVHGLNSPGRYSAILTRGERVICVSDAVRAHLVKHYPDLDPARLRVIERGVDPDHFAAARGASADARRRWRAAFPALDAGALLLLPGRGTRLKGHAVAIRLLSRLRRGGIDARLLLLGAIEEGREAYLAELQALAQSLGVQSQFVMTPPRPDVVEAYAAADLVLQVSTQPEAFGRTAAEALASGRPLLGFAHGGVGDLLQRHYPAGAVGACDEDALLARAQTLLAAPPPVPPFGGTTLAQMQAQTLAVYAEVDRG
jgi:glycosyltransferase involved in cell wall biosynthesis